MKAFYLAAVAIAAASAPLAAHAADAGSTFSPIQAYGTVGYASANQEGITLGAIQGRLGARFGKYLGVEGELAGGVKNADVNVGGGTATLKLSSEVGAYVVGFLPVSPSFDAFARVGYGRTNISASAGNGGSATGSDNSWNYGGGGQYFFTQHDGVRADYTHYHYNGGGGANVWSVAYVRKF
jgi:outer membrane immunogenic protein